MVGRALLPQWPTPIWDKGHCSEHFQNIEHFRGRICNLSLKIQYRVNTQIIPLNDHLGPTRMNGGLFICSSLPLIVLWLCFVVVHCLGCFWASKVQTVKILLQPGLEPVTFWFLALPAVHKTTALIEIWRQLLNFPAELFLLDNEGWAGGAVNQT